jgi:ATPase subunit of ABC transporter with duplicated ATPase domains
VQRQQWSKIKQKPTRSVTKTGRICKRDDGSLPENKGRMTHSAKAIKKRMQQAIEREQVNKPYLEKKRQLSLSTSKMVNNSRVLQLENLTKQIGKKLLFAELNLSLATGSRLAITGANGCGKSTLLRILLGYQPVDSGTVTWAMQAEFAYYDQMATKLDLNATVIENCRTVNQDETLIRTTLGQLLFAGDLVQQTVNNLSFGERSKVALAMVLLQQANILVLDEPTNHLEINAREALEVALQAYTGTIIFVSHDRYFCDKLATEELAL